jgi:phosphomannomutase
MTRKTESLLIGDLMARSGVGFGTSGARGLVQAMTDRVCYAYTAGFLRYLKEVDQIRLGDTVAVAGDYRSSTPRIMAATCQAIRELGYRPINCGFVPSPAVAAFGIGEGSPSLMVTGSHIPDDRNGIKFNKPAGEILKEDEAGIKVQRVELPAAMFDEHGAFREAPELPSEDSMAYRRYRDRYLDFFPVQCLRGMRVLSYEHSSVARTLLADLLHELGAEVLPRGRSDRFVPVDTEAIRPQDVVLARQWASSEGFDAIVSTDGDGDRPLIGDEHGEWLRGDVAGVLTARLLEADSVVTPVSSNTVLEASGWFDATLRTRIGSPFVIAGMAQAAAAGGRRVVGFEANGGFLTWHDLVCDGKSLTALPTRDAIIVILSLLLAARSQNLTLSALRARLPARYTASNRLEDFPTEVSLRCIGRLRAGGAAAIEAQFPALGKLNCIDETDGLRMTFTNGEIVHLRPSGNAPELRCYNEAATVERAKALNAACMAILTNWRP